jgi:hypothetical protein
VRPASRASIPSTRGKILGFCLSILIVIVSPRFIRGLFDLCPKALVLSRHVLRVNKRATRRITKAPGITSINANSKNDVMTRALTPKRAKESPTGEKRGGTAVYPMGRICAWCRPVRVTLNVREGSEGDGGVAAYDVSMGMGGRRNRHPITHPCPPRHRQHGLRGRRIRRREQRPSVAWSRSDSRARVGRQNRRNGHGALRLAWAAPPSISGKLRRRRYCQPPSNDLWIFVARPEEQQRRRYRSVLDLHAAAIGVASLRDHRTKLRQQAAGAQGFGSFMLH